jgi:prophage regulatory protein
LFPRPVRLGVRAVGWRESDIVAWLASRKTTDQMG